MGAKGHDFDTPEDARAAGLDDRAKANDGRLETDDGFQPSETERRLATADAECQQTEKLPKVFEKAALQKQAEFRVQREQLILQWQAVLDQVAQSSNKTFEKERKDLASTTAGN